MTHADRQVAKRRSEPLTRDALLHALRVKLSSKGADLLSLVPSAQAVADAIRIHGLETALCGTHDGRPVTFARGYELVFGERLTLDRAGKAR